MVKIAVPLPEAVEKFGEKVYDAVASVDGQFGFGAWSLTSSFGFWAKTFAYFGVVLFVYCLIEQFLLHYKRRRTGKSMPPGPWFAVPIIGAILAMVKDPHGFWEQQRLYAPSGLSWNSVAGYFMLFATKTDISRRILSINGEDTFKMILHPNGWKILGDNNIAFKSGKVHKALRHSFINLFTRKALESYLHIQEDLILRRLTDWFKTCGKDQEMRLLVRDLNLRTSQLVFVGPYLEDHDAFGELYLHLTEGFLSLPINLPGTGLWKAVRARVKVVDILTVAVQKAKAHCQAGGEPRCLLDYWCQRIQEEVKEADASGEPHPIHTEDQDMAETMMDFLFASQDASTASLTWTLALMADHPDMCDRVREEQKQLRPNGEPFSFDLLEKMTYTRAVIKEILRYRPPAVMVPNMAMKDMQLSDDFIAPKGSLVIPSLWAACNEGFPNPFDFDPERMMPERHEDIVYKKNFMTFGTGPHACVGREYAINHLMCFLGTLVAACSWTRARTSKSDKILYLPTIYPYDCKINFNPF